ncbi:pilus assembly protein PilO [Myxacorys almedinensis]|uniref:Pilus assembly protein PilO n=1 Tax=Myxacorys almedinensis A TaxID=2690445 RepID=A0A8J7Z1U0_9CYAN|nr:pilus assembly protein PilO [Myxacorys almedinensis]NDJ16598.1 pilus assembly protein PilO [Myxacorys almedinensis A]
MNGGDFIQDSEFELSPSYPTVFGLTMTPVVQGVLFGLGGVLACGAIVMYLVSPTWENYQALDAKVKEKSEQVKQQDAIRQQIKEAKAKLEKSKQQREQVYALFANEKSMDTLLLDLNQQIEKNNVGLLTAKQSKLNACPIYVRQAFASSEGADKFNQEFGALVAQAQLSKFKPSEKGVEVVNDGSLGAAVDNKLKRQSIDVEFEGNFNQTQSIFRTIERLQPLLLVRNLDVKVGDGAKAGTQLFEVEPDGRIRYLTNCQPDTKITTSFQMQALLPLNDGDRKAIAATPTPTP